jgi:hypothetical protein
VFKILYTHLSMGNLSLEHGECYLNARKLVGLLLLVNFIKEMYTCDFRQLHFIMQCSSVEKLCIWLCGSGKVGPVF